MPCSDLAAPAPLLQSPCSSLRACAWSRLWAAQLQAAPSLTAPLAAVRRLHWRSARRRHHLRYLPWLAEAAARAQQRRRLAVRLVRPAALELLELQRRMAVRAAARLQRATSAHRRCSTRASTAALQDVDPAPVRAPVTAATAAAGAAPLQPCARRAALWLHFQAGVRAAAVGLTRRWLVAAAAVAAGSAAAAALAAF